jgi:hypothetical protein
MADDFDQMMEHVAEIEAAVGLKPGFLRTLMRDGDDWAFVIKLHAFAEAVLTDLLTLAVGREELRGLFASLPMADQKRGKIALAVKLGTLDEGRAAFFRALARVRNHFAHDVASAGATIEDYVGKLGAQHQVQFWRDVARGHTVESTVVDSEGNRVPVEVFAAAHPRFMMGVCALSAVSLIQKVRTSDPEGRSKLVTFLSTLKPLGPSAAP